VPARALHDSAPNYRTKPAKKTSRAARKAKTATPDRRLWRPRRRYAAGKFQKD
jgi:hypothetical protein